MYQEIYKILCSTGIACKHPEDLWRDKNGEVVEVQEQAFGCKSEFELIHPNHLIFVDEVGSTPQAKDGQVGGQTHLWSIDERPQNWAATKMPILPCLASLQQMVSHFSVQSYLLKNL